MKVVSGFGALLALAAVGLCFVPGSEGELAHGGTTRVSFSGTFSPKRLPRQGSRPISVRLGGRITTSDQTDPPPLEAIEIAINRHGRLDPAALPACSRSAIQPATTSYARRVCDSAKIGEGTFDAAVAIPQQSPFPSRGTVTAFNGREGGKPVVLLHIYGTEPLPTSFTLSLSIGRGKGDFGTVLRGTLPSVEANVGFVTGLTLRLDRTLGAGHRAYLSAGCPAPKGLPGAVFPLSRLAFVFAGGKTLRSTLVRSCHATG